MAAYINTSVCSGKFPFEPCTGLDRKFWLNGKCSSTIHVALSTVHVPDVYSCQPAVFRQSADRFVGPAILQCFLFFRCQGHGAVDTE